MSKELFKKSMPLCECVLCMCVCVLCEREMEPLKHHKRKELFICRTRLA